MWQNFVDAFTKVNNFVNGLVWGWPVIIFMLGTGLLLSVRTKFLQVRKFKDSLQSTIVPTVKSMGKKDAKNKKSVSPFEAFSAAISGTVGTGNIIGVTAAIMAGGPGAVLWMWISAFFGMVTNYAENVLGLYYRKKNPDGSFSGGAFYYITYGLKQKWLGYVAAVFCLLAAAGMSGVQANKISGTFVSVFQNDATWLKILIGAIVAVLVSVVILGGIKRIGKIASYLVPFMSILFIIMAFVIIGKNGSAIPRTFSLIFSSAFSMKAVSGGVGGYLFATIIKEGMARGVFSNEAGLGSSVIAHSASDTKEPVKQGLWGVFEVFLDTFIICTLTALTILTSNIANGSYDSGEFFTRGDSENALLAFSSNLGTFGSIAFSIILPLFAFTTILAWSYYGEKATEFCFSSCSEKGKKIATSVFKIIFVLFIVFAAVIESDLLWDLDDTFNGLMAIPNLIALVFLSGKVARITNNYYKRKKGEKIAPMLSAYEDLNREFAEQLQMEETENAESTK